MAIFKNPRGTWTCKLYYRDWNGEKKQKKKEGFKTKREAKEFEAHFIAGERRDSGIIFDSLAKAYMEDCRLRLRPTTCRTKESLIRLKMLPYFSSTPINEINGATVRKWQNEIISGGNYSKTYLKTINAQLSAILNFAVKYYNLSANPVKTCGSMGGGNSCIQFWTIEEFDRFIKKVDSTVYRAIFSLLFFSGIRIGELLALTPKDFNENPGSVSINKSYTVYQGKELIQAPKTEKSNRVVTLPKQITDKIIRLCRKTDENHRLFTVSRQTINNEMEKACMKSGVKKIRIHDLRHSHASLLIEMGFSPIIICERLGHERIETTLNIYSHLYPGKHDEVAKKLESLV